MCTHDTMFYGGSVMPRFVMIYRVNTVHDKVLPDQPGMEPTIKYLADTWSVLKFFR